MDDYKTAKGEEFWARYKERESIVEKFEVNGVSWVRELWPMHEPREHATPWEGGGMEKIEGRDVFWTKED